MTKNFYLLIIITTTNNNNNFSLFLRYHMFLHKVEFKLKNIIDYYR